MLQKLLQLAKEEGGKAFVMNENTGEIFCVMPLEMYREMKRSNMTTEPIATDSISDIGSLSEEELLRKINREISIWREQQKDKAEIILPARHASQLAGVADRPTREDRAGVPEVKKIAKDDSSAVVLSESRASASGGKDLGPQTTPIAKAPILETEEEFFLEMA